MNAQSQLPRVIATTLLVLILVILAIGCANPQAARFRPTAPITDQASSASPGTTDDTSGSVCGVPATKR